MGILRLLENKKKGIFVKHTIYIYFYPEKSDRKNRRERDFVLSVIELCQKLINSLFTLLDQLKSK